jgi:hypothetical protein
MGVRGRGKRGRALRAAVFSRALLRAACAGRRAARELEVRQALPFVHVVRAFQQIGSERDRTPALRPLITQSYVVFVCRLSGPRDVLSS